MVKPVLSREAVYDKEDRFEMKAGDYPDNILPIKEGELNRPIIIWQNCQINGVIFGGLVELHDNIKAMSVYGDHRVIIRNNCQIGGNIQSNGEITVESNTMVIGDIIGKSIGIKDNIRIGGNVIGIGNINIGNNVEIGGFVISLGGSIAIGDYSKVYDIISNKNIEFGKGVVIIDPVIWSQDGKINFSKIKIASSYDVARNDTNIAKSNEINPHYIASNTFDMKSIFNRLNKSLSEI